MPKIQHPVELWNNTDFMEEVRAIVALKWSETPDHFPSLCSYMAQAQELAREHIMMGADPHDMYFLSMAQLFALGFEAALHDLATREPEP